eukprot:EG_transcript_9578
MASLDQLQEVQEEAKEEWGCLQRELSENRQQLTSLEAQLASSRAEAEAGRQAQEALAQALEADMRRLEASLLEATTESEATQRRCAEVQALAQETRQQFEARMAMEWAALQQLEGLTAGSVTVTGASPTPPLLEAAELRLVAGWQRMADDLRQGRDRLTQLEQEHRQQVTELRRTVQEQQAALAETTRQLHEGAVAATAREAAMRGSLEEKAHQVQAAQQECREAQRREWEAQQQLTLRMAAEWKSIQELGLLGPETVSGPHPSADRLEAAEAQLVAVWQRTQADLRQRLAKELEVEKVLRLWPEVTRLAAEHGQLAAEVADLRQQLEEAAEQSFVAEQQRDEWEGNAKEMALQLQEHMVGEGRLLMAVQCASSGIPKTVDAAGSDVDQALAALDALVADRAALERRLEAAEAELARHRRWSAGIGPSESPRVESAGQLVAGLREAMAELESRMAAAVGQAAALNAGLAAEDTLGACERIMGQARDVLRSVAEQRVPTPGPGDGAAEAAGLPLELVLTRLQAADHAQ